MCMFVLCLHMFISYVYMRVCVRVCVRVCIVCIYKNYICKTWCDMKLPNTKFIALNLN